MFKSSSAVLLVLLAACGGSDASPTGTTTSTPAASFKSNPCPGGSVQLTAAQSARVDCSAGGTTVTLAGNGASYIIVPQFATDQVANTLVRYSIASGSAVSASIAPSALRSAVRSARTPASMRALVAGSGGVLPPYRPMTAQLSAERFLRARQRSSSGGLTASLSRAPFIMRSASTAPVPALGTIRSFHVASSFTTNAFKSVGAKLSFVGTNVLLYVDTLSPASGFTAQQLTDFGTLFDRTLYPIDTTAFGSPADLDQNGHVIMLMSPVVNADAKRLALRSQFAPKQ